MASGTFTEEIAKTASVIAATTIEGLGDKANLLTPTTNAVKGDGDTVVITVTFDSIPDVVFMKATIGE